MTWDIQNLKRASGDKLVAGICGGLGLHTPVPGWLWRVLFVLLFAAWGIGFYIYVLLWIFMPRDAVARTDSDAA